ncbi:MAG: SRPBCC family protein [Bacteroidota bacterium]|nr:SRPBCC family protein [Bacteroidota bacterium]
MAVHSIKNVQKIPITLQQAWDFYSDHANLQTITPPKMKFKVISQHHGEKLYPGQIIEYQVSPVLGIPLYWMTEITHIMPPVFFADEQRKGPYQFWQHQHHFKAIEGGVEMTDIIHYRNPLWLLGKLANILFVKRKLRAIFEYRFHKVEELFGKWPGGQEMVIELR